MKQSEQIDLVQAGLVVWECMRVLAAGTVEQWGSGLRALWKFWALAGLSQRGVLE